MDENKVIKQVKSYTSGPVYQFWFEDGILHMWTNQRSGLFTIPINDHEQLEFLADVFHHPEEGTVYEFKRVETIEH